MIPPLFALADCNIFYASCERLFNPALMGRPLIVLSNNDGCVVARSNEAKALLLGRQVRDAGAFGVHFQEQLDPQTLGLGQNYLWGSMAAGVPRRQHLLIEEIGKMSEAKKRLPGHEYREMIHGSW